LDGLDKDIGGGSKIRAGNGRPRRRF
jgi:hypothetical protein